MATPVDSDAILLLTVLSPVDSEPTLLFVVLNPVDNELIPVDVDVDSVLIAVTAALSCEPLIASVLVVDTRPAATFVIVRTGWNWLESPPTLTVLIALVPLNVYV
ncbi:chromosome partitioning protein ParA [Burkholderia sp. HI2714]|nr:chromosome partitioning protein ParA [Burkholderia sp. HI2714]